MHSTHPSKTTSPKGLVSLDPPRKAFQIKSAKVSAALSLWNPTLAPPPPRLKVKAFPFDWHALKSSETAEQSARAVPGLRMNQRDCTKHSTFQLTRLRWPCCYRSMRKVSATCNIACLCGERTFARFISGKPPVANEPY